MDITSSGDTQFAVRYLGRGHVGDRDYGAAPAGFSGTASKQVVLWIATTDFCVPQWLAPAVPFAVSKPEPALFSPELADFHL